MCALVAGGALEEEDARAGLPTPPSLPPEPKARISLPQGLLSSSWILRLLARVSPWAFPAAAAVAAVCAVLCAAAHPGVLWASWATAGLQSTCVSEIVHVREGFRAKCQCGLHGSDSQYKGKNLHRTDFSRKETKTKPPPPRTEDNNLMLLEKRRC